MLLTALQHKFLFVTILGSSHLQSSCPYIYIYIYIYIYFKTKTVPYIIKGGRKNQPREQEQRQVEYLPSRLSYGRSE